MNKYLSRVPQKYWAYLALSIWAILCIKLLHNSSYGIDEGAAQALLLVWSISDNVVSPIVTLGFPDFRAVFLAPAGILWTGDVFPAKILTVVVTIIAVWAMHSWRLFKGESESALLASGLFLVSPLLLVQIDTISVAVFLIFSFALATWADSIYRDSQKAFGGLYFGQLFLCFVTTSLHPIGLAYPLALLWSWFKNPVDKKHQLYFFYGIGASTLLALSFTMGWNHITWFNNPVKIMSSVLLGPSSDDEFGVFHWIAGIAMSFLIFIIILKQLRHLWADLLGRILLLGFFIGLFVGDSIFGFVVLAVSLYWGLSLLLNNSSHPQGGFWQQRGFVLVLTMFLLTICMITNKSRFLNLDKLELSPRDTLIKTLAEDSGLFLSEDSSHDNSPKKSFKVASQWPALTMLACRCDVLPLPPDAKDSSALFDMLHGINYLIFDPRDLTNNSLSHNLANMESGKTETVVLQSGGVVVQINDSSIISPKVVH